MHSPLAEPAPIRTGDGSLTLHNVQFGEQYHSKHGGVSESMHVFIKSGIEASGKERLDVLEVGLGTGLNLLLTWIRCLEGKCRVDYTALEPFPLQRELLESLHHCQDLAWPGLHEPFLELMCDEPGLRQATADGLTFRNLPGPVLEFNEPDSFDVVFFDAFSPRSQPEMWTLAVFQRMHAVLRKGGMLVTYCAKGEVRRTMQAAGFTVERLKGPPGKSHMLRAIKS